MDKYCDCVQTNDSPYVEWRCWPLKESSVQVPPRTLMRTNNQLYDITNITGGTINYILDTSVDFQLKRYGGWSSVSINTEDVMYADYVGTTENFVVWHNDKGYHSFPSYMNSIHNSLLRTMVRTSGNHKESKKAEEYGISTFLEPLKIRAHQVWDQSVIQIITDFGTALMMLFAFSLVPASLIHYIIGERIREEKQVQILSGVSKATYWLVAFLWDMTMGTLFVLMAMVLIQTFNVGSYVARSNFSGFVVLAFTFLYASLGLVYLMEKLYDETSYGQMMVLCTLGLVGIFSLVISLLLQLLWQIPGVTLAKEILDKAFLAFPPFALANGLILIAINNIQADLFAPYGVDLYDHPLSWNVLGRHITILVLEGFIFQGLNLLIEYEFLECSLVKRYVYSYDL